MTGEITVTEADMNRAADFLESWEPGPELTVDKLARAFARHAAQARLDALGEAAKHFDALPPTARAYTNAEAASAIRALAGESKL